MKISVVIPVYNTEKYIDECMQSVVDQTYRDLEIVVVNDGSTDGTLAKLQAWAAKDARVKLINSENRGASHARNLALDNATGDVIVFVDSDDTIDLDYFGKTISAMIDSGCDICFTAYRRVTPEFTVALDAEHKVYSKQGTMDLLADHVILQGYICSAFYKREVLQGMRFDENIVIMEDLIFKHDVLKKHQGNILFYPHQGYNYRQRCDSAVMSGWSVRKLRDSVTVMQYLRANATERFWRRYINGNSGIDNLFSQIRNNLISTDAERAKRLADLKELANEIHFCSGLSLKSKAFLLLMKLPWFITHAMQSVWFFIKSRRKRRGF